MRNFHSTLATLALLGAAFLSLGCQTDRVQPARSENHPAVHRSPAQTAPSQSLQSGLRLPAVFSHNMVLQQGTRVPVWGWAIDGDTVTVTFRDQTAKAQARNGTWAVELGALKPDDPATLTVSSGTQTLQFTNVLAGEVWVCSGQSNMEWPMTKAFEPENDIADSANPMLRLFTVPKTKAAAPLDDLPANNRPQWREAGPESVAGFSAVAYYFGRELQKSRGVPVGLIHTSWGGSPVEAWTSRWSLAANPHHEAVTEYYSAAMENYRRAFADYERKKAEAAAQPSSEAPKLTVPRPPWQTSELYNGMIAPLIPYAIKGAIWYQGESNAPRAHQYRSLFPDMISDWRRSWGQGNFPFLAVQLAPFKAIQPNPGDSDWAELREAQFLATTTIPKVGLAVITDVGEEKDIHPGRKAPVGGRLAIAARALAYGEKIVHSGPVFKNLKVKGDKAILSFDHVGSGLEARGGALKGFAICGPDRKFIWALAEIQKDNTILVRSPNVSTPVAVRYGWADFPVVNLWNKEGLPAVPFRTDDFPLTTAMPK